MEWHLVAEAREWLLLVVVAIQVGSVLVMRSLSHSFVSKKEFEETAAKVSGHDTEIATLKRDIENVPGWSTLNKIKENLGRVNTELVELRSGLEGLHTSQEQTRGDVRTGHAELRTNLRRIEDFLLAQEKEK